MLEIPISAAAAASFGPAPFSLVIGASRIDGRGVVFSGASASSSGSEDLTGRDRARHVDRRRFRSRSRAASITGQG